MQIKEVIQAWGHKNVRATHKTTFEVTKEKNLSKRGDCIIAISANKALADLTPQFKENLRKENTKITVCIQAGEIAEFVNAFGSPKLILTHPKEIVVRKSDYVCSRTLAIRADKAAYDLSRKLVEKLRNPKQKIEITIKVEA
ncbi:MAG: DUF371 domain-containing protein [Candidatus Bathycorpusculaceae bacterium]